MYDSLNLAYVTDELLQILASLGRDNCALKTLGILATSVEDLENTSLESDDIGPSNKAWEEVVDHNPQLVVNISYRSASKPNTLCLNLPVIY